MSAVRFFSCFQRAAAPWTCRACERATVATATSKATGPFQRQQWRRFATEAAEAAVRAHPRPPKRRRWRWVAGGAVVVGGGAFILSDDLQHAAKATPRIYRVATTLFLCLYDYRTTLKKHEDPNYEQLLNACHQRCANRTFRAMELNGSIYIKLGQHLSSWNYLLPPEWCDTFIPLQDRCPVSSLESIEEMVKKDTGHEISDFFSDFAPKPIGAASLAQVHIATVKGTDQKVAVKVQHPSLDVFAPLDIALTRITFATIKAVFPSYDLTWLSDEMEIGLPQELDFEREAANANRTREYFKTIKEAPLVIPEVIWAKRRILVMEYITGKRPDDLAWMDSNGIDRDEVSAALARIFNEMIFGTNAPLHCDPHGGNIAIRKNTNPFARYNFDIILYDHGLYRDIPQYLRRAYAKLWLAVLDNDETRMRRYAKEVANIGDDIFPLFASAVTGRDYMTLQEGGASTERTEEEKARISQAIGGLISDVLGLLGKVPRVMLLVLKTNDLTRSLDENLHTRYGPARTFLILARYCARTVFEEQMEFIRGSLLWPHNLWLYVSAWCGYARYDVMLFGYESYLWGRKVLGLKPVMTEWEKFRESNPQGVP